MKTTGQTEQASRHVTQGDHHGRAGRLSRQELRAQARANRLANGSRRVTRSTLELTIGVSLVGTPRTIRGMRKA